MFTAINMCGSTSHSNWLIYQSRNQLTSTRLSSIPSVFLLLLLPTARIPKARCFVCVRSCCIATHSIRRGWLSWAFAWCCASLSVDITHPLSSCVHILNRGTRSRLLQSHIPAIKMLCLNIAGLHMWHLRLLLFEPYFFLLWYHDLCLPCTNDVTLINTSVARQKEVFEIHDFGQPKFFVYGRLESGI